VPVIAEALTFYGIPVVRLVATCAGLLVLGLALIRVWPNEKRVWRRRFLLGGAIVVALMLLIALFRFDMGLGRGNGGMGETTVTPPGGLDAGPWVALEVKYVARTDMLLATDLRTGEPSFQVRLASERWRKHLRERLEKALKSSKGTKPGSKAGTKAGTKNRTALHLSPQSDPVPGPAWNALQEIAAACDAQLVVSRTKAKAQNPSGKP
jgi:hypothetical protein